MNGGDIGITVKIIQKSRFSTTLPEMFRVMGIMDTVHLLKGCRFRNKGEIPAGTPESAVSRRAWHSGWPGLS